MIIDCISDLHGYYPELEGGDLLIIAGDLTAMDKPIEYQEFKAWLLRQDYRKKVVVAGNHDNYLLNPCKSLWVMPNLDYLCDSGTEFEGVKIWGSPWTSKFSNINPNCCAFTVRNFDNADKLLDKYWKKIHKDTDILITHSPPYGILDENKNHEHVGSVTLLNRLQKIKPKLHVFGHIHEQGGKQVDWIQKGQRMTFVNASIVDENYQLVNKPKRVIF